MNSWHKLKSEAVVSQLNLIDLAMPHGRERFRGIVRWVDSAMNQFSTIFEEAPPGVLELRMPLGVMMTEFAGALEKTLDVTSDAIIADEAADEYNRAATLQDAVLHLLAHLQRHSPTDLRELIPVPTKIKRECLCPHSHAEENNDRPN